MILCTLCKEKEANQTGSHIFSRFLIKSAINIDEKKLRGKEAVFRIGSQKFTKAYIGSRITDEDVNKLFGRPVDELNLEKENPHTKSYFLCSTCEKRFKICEDYFSENFYSKYKTEKLLVDKHNKFDTLQLNNISPSLIRLFIYSLAWRASVVNYENFKLKNKEEEILRTILNENLDRDKNSIQVSELPLFVSLFELDIEHPTKNFIFLHPESKNPYFFVVNELSFCLFFNKQKKYKSNHFLKNIGYDHITNELINWNKDNLIVGFLKNQDRKNLEQGFFKIYVNRKMKQYSMYFKKNHNRLFGFYPDKNLTKHFLYFFTKDESFIGIQYSVEHLTNFSVEYFNWLAKIR